MDNGFKEAPLPIFNRGLERTFLCLERALCLRSALKPAQLGFVKSLISLEVFFLLSLWRGKKQRIEPYC